MPILNGRISDQGKEDKSQLEPAEALELHGPSFVGVLIQAGPKLNRQNAIEGILLVDTGALETCIDQSAAEQAGLQVVDSGLLSSATQADQVVPIYTGVSEVRESGVTITCDRAYGVNLSPQGKIALLGRDVLRRSILIYNGLDGSYNLSM